MESAAADLPGPVDPDPDRILGPVFGQPSAILFVFAGGTLGTGTRYLISLVPPHPSPLPLAIFLINICGAFLLGLLLERIARVGDDRGPRLRLRLVAGTGFLGGFTTYSALAMDSVSLLASGRPAAGLGYALATLVLGGLASWLGIRWGQPGRSVSRS